MNLDQRLIAQRGFHGAQPRGIHAALIGLHPVFQYDLCAAAYLLKSLMALPLVPATAPLFLAMGCRLTVAVGSDRP